MLKRLLAIIGLSTATAVVAAPPYSPYNDTAADAIYNLLFCDDLPAFLAENKDGLADWQTTLAASTPDLEQLRSLAFGESNEGRIRALAFNKLRQIGQPVPSQVILGVVTEVGLDGGLDALAAFSDGGVRYINQSAKMLFIEGRLEQTAEILPRLFEAAQGTVNQLKPLQGTRWAPPPNGTVRFTFITSGGLYLGQGPIGAMQRDPKGAAILKSATELLQAVVKLGTK